MVLWLGRIVVATGLIFCYLLLLPSSLFLSARQRAHKWSHLEHDVLRHCNWQHYRTRCPEVCNPCLSVGCAGTDSKEALQASSVLSISAQHLVEVAQFDP